MSLFPAYVAQGSSVTDSDTVNDSPTPGTSEKDAPTPSKGHTDWLNNSSYIVPQEQKDTSPEPKTSKRKEAKIEKGLKTKKRKHLQEEDGCYFYEDRKADFSKFSVLTAKPKPPITVNEEPQKKTRHKKKNRAKRKVKCGPDSGKQKVEKIPRYFDKESLKDDEVTPAITIEEFTRRTEEFNKKLAADPSDTEAWLGYVLLQDLGMGSAHGIAEKKLSILDKALSENPTSESLLNQKFMISEKILPPDKLIAEAKALTQKDKGNLTAWRWLIKCHQFNLSRMVVPNVLSAYSSALGGLHSTHTAANKMIDVLLECGIFLRQAGLWETLWTWLELCLELNLTKPGSGAFNISVKQNDDKIKETEDTIVTCGLPLGSLWLRVEHLREAVHFLPAPASDDPQRYVFADDVAHLLFPVTREQTPRLIAVVLALFKLPPLPMTDSFSHFVGLKTLPWAHESTEVILTASFHSGIIPIKSDYIDAARELLVGPQFINEKMGQAEYFELVNAVVDRCMKECKCEDTAVSLACWQTRWWRYVARLQGGDRRGLLPKAKRLLKEHRHCVCLYVEYALLERELASYEAAHKVLHTALQLRPSPLMATANDKRHLLYLYRIYAELLLTNDFNNNREKALEVLVGAALGMAVKNVKVTNAALAKAKEKYADISVEVQSEYDVYSDVTLTDVVVPQTAVSWLACHAWFLYLTETVWEATAVLETAIQAIMHQLPNNNLNLGRCIMEGYFEVLVNIMHHYCVGNFGQNNVLQEILTRATKLFPDNIHFLNIAMATSTKQHSWSAQVIHDNSVLPQIFSVFAARTMMLSENPESRKKSQGLMYSLLSKLSTQGVTADCPLVWRLLLQFVASEDHQQTKRTFYQAAEKCPWVKAIYFGAAQVLPEELTQIQDLLVEKELRLHITPEELEILREDTS